MTDFTIEIADSENTQDQAITDLLTRIYVAEGFTDEHTAASLFQAANVRSRGRLYTARHRIDHSLAGMIILVPPDSPARKLADENEAELHLLAVDPGARRHGIGRRLVETAIAAATDSEYDKLVLWTQPTMTAAQNLYRSCGFYPQEVRNFSIGGKQFLVFEKRLR